MTLKEILAALSVVAVMIGVPVLIALQNAHVVASQADGAKVFTITGVAKDGLWTLEKVDGTNNWWKTFERAILYIEEGEEVVLRLQSSDVHHRFYSPGLNIGPVDIEPGHTEVVRFRAGPPGMYEYYCTSICGECHFHMYGWIVVSPKGQAPMRIDTSLLTDVDCPHDLTEPPREDMIQWGRYLYRKNGCATCHGTEGKGGVRNFNYVKNTIPAHDTLAEKFFLEEREEAEAFIELLLNRIDLDSLDQIPDIPQFTIVLTQYKTARDLITKGKHCAKLDSAGLVPPLHMPSWREVLSDHDVDSIIAYLLTLYPWEEEEEFDE